ncbi:MAG: hypothetical protein L6R41_008321 [Letrouitia leprolyta]|nr:MAG: hypothetical protein L6R41_008321 [Letrouitia leprolyta]
MRTAEQETNGATGSPLTTKSKVLETGASMVQSFKPVKALCAHLNAFHVYASDPNRCVEANHYCAHINEGKNLFPFIPQLAFLTTLQIFPNHPNPSTRVDVRQCLIYDTPEPTAKLIGIEYMISAKLYKTLDATERKLWHSHVFEVKSGMLCMPGPDGLPTGVWEQAETKEMEDIVGLYGKTYHFWQVDRGDKVPLGEPQLMGSLIQEGQGGEALKKMWKERDEKFGVSTEQKKGKREYIGVPEVHEDADQAWKK